MRCPHLAPRSKGDLGAALAHRYTEDGANYLAELLATSNGATWCMERYTEIFRSALANDNRMCLCGIMSAELDDLPPQVRTEVDKFAETNVGWITKVFATAKPATSGQHLQEHAMAIFAAIEGAQLNWSRAAARTSPSTIVRSGLIGAQASFRDAGRRSRFRTCNARRSRSLGLPARERAQLPCHACDLGRRVPTAFARLLWRTSTKTKRSPPINAAPRSRSVAS